VQIVTQALDMFCMHANEDLFQVGWNITFQAFENKLFQMVFLFGCWPA